MIDLIKGMVTPIRTVLELRLGSQYVTGKKLSMSMWSHC